MIKDTSSRNILITALVLIVLQGANLVGVAVNRTDINNYGKKIDMVYADYVPMWFFRRVATECQLPDTGNNRQYKQQVQEYPLR